MQRLADRAAGRLHVLGVDTGDGRDAAASFGADKGVTMPDALRPRTAKLLAALGKINLPITVFVDADGRSRHVYTGDRRSTTPTLGAAGRATHPGVTVDR